MTRFAVAMTLLWRDFRRGELTLLVLAVLLACGSASGILLFTQRLQMGLQQRAADFLAADLAVTAPTSLTDSWLQQAASRNLHQSHTLEFNSMLLENGQMLLAAVKAVSCDYPLRGELSLQDGVKVKHGPAPGEAWVEPRILSSLQLQLGDKVMVGELSLRISAILIDEPDRRGNFVNFAPRLMMHAQDVAATAVIQPGSQLHYTYQFSGAAENIAGYKQWLLPLLTPSQQLLDLQQQRPDLTTMLQRASQYLGLAAVITMLIAGVAIALASQQYAQAHFDVIAVLRCLGYRRIDIGYLYAYQLLGMAGICCALGCGLGWLLQYFLSMQLRTVLPYINDNPNWQAYVWAVLLCMGILLVFAGPALWRLQNVPVLRVLRRDLLPAPIKQWISYVLGLLLCLVLIQRYAGDWRATALILLIGVSILLLMTGGLVYLLSMSGSGQRPLRLPWRLALQNLRQSPVSSAARILAFVLSLMAMALSFTVRFDIVADWQKQLPTQAPNFFALNIFPNQLTEFAGFLQQARMQSNTWYPVVRGRLIAINGESVQKRTVQGSQGQFAIQRELNLTWAEQLPADNHITAGQPWQSLSPGMISVEQKVAENLQIKPGDQLRFLIGAEEVSAQVVNLRSVQWQSMRPNFYMLFSPGTLKDFAYTYLSSFYVAEADKPVLQKLLQQFPAATLFDVSSILQQLQAMLAQLTQALDGVLYFTLAAGVMVLISSVHADLPQRLQTAALLRALGANRGLLALSLCYEFALQGSVAGLLAAVANELIRYFLYENVLHIAYIPDIPDIQLDAALPLLGGFIVSFFGLISVRKVWIVAPMQVLRRFE